MLGEAIRKRLPFGGIGGYSAFPSSLGNGLSDVYRTLKRLGLVSCGNGRICGKLPRVINYINARSLNLRQSGERNRGATEKLEFDAFRKIDFIERIVGITIHAATPI
jgi:hypothetical protein